MRRTTATALLATSLIALSVAVAVPASALPAPGTGTGKGWCTKYGATGVTAKFDFGNVWACSSTATKGPTPFDENGTDSFQCVELSARYLWAIWGLWVPHPSDGWDLVANVHASYPTTTVVKRPSPSSLPGTGYVISLGPGGAVDASVGHTAIIISADPSTGVFVTLSQNFPEGEAGKQTWKVDLTGHHNGQVQYRGPGGIGAWTSARWLVLPPPPFSTTITPASAHPADKVCTNNGYDQGATTLTLAGKYYYRDEGAELVIKSKNWLLDNSPRVVVSAKGDWSFTFDVPNRPDGNYPVTVADAGGVVATLMFASTAYTCFAWNNSNWQWDAAGWDASTTMAFYIDGVQMDLWTTFPNGSLPIRHFTYDCPDGMHTWEVTGSLDGGPGYATGSITCSSTASTGRASAAAARV